MAIQLVDAGPGSVLQPGDVILQLDGIAVADLVEQRKPFYAASNEAVRLRDIAQFLTRGSCGPVQVVVSRDKDVVVLQTERALSTSLALHGRAPHDLAGPAFQMVANGVAYLKLSAVTASESANYVRSAAGTKGLIIDLRNYPSDFVVFTLGQLLVTNPTPFTLPTTPDLTNPGAFHWMAPITLMPQSPHYDGKVVILIDEVTQSQAEYTTMAFRAAPGSLVIGSTTAGADGNVVLISLPGGFTSYFSGAGVFYADKRPTQRVGIIPDIEIRPTIEAMRAGRDELLEEAILQIIDTPSPGIRFSVPEHGAASSVNAGTGLIPSVGYGVIQPDSGTTPSGLAIFGFRQNGVLVSEASVPAVPLITKGRIYGQISAVVGTGIAIANPSNQNATMSFYFTDGTGTIVSSGTTTIAAKNQIARFLSQAPFNGRSPLSGTFTFESSVPIAVTALRGITNERNEFLLTTLPVTDLQAPLNSGSLLFPHFADGAGWATQLVLVNPTDVLLTGTAQFRDSSGTTVSLRPYSIPPKTSQSLETAGLGSTAVVGSILVSATGGAVPSGLAIFSFRKSGVRVAEAGVPALPSGTAFNLYVEAFGTIQTGIAVANASATAVTVTLEVFNADGSATNLKGSVSIPANGQVAAFVQQIPGLTELKTPFQGTIRVSSSAPIAVVGLRGRYNERSDFLITTTPPVDEAAAPATAPLYFPHLATGGGYSTQFVLFNSRPGQVSIGTLSIFAQTGALMRIR